MDDLPHQTDDFAGFGVTVSLEFRINQRFVYFDLEPASVRRDQGQILDLVLELLK